MKNLVSLLLILSLFSGCRTQEKKATYDKSGAPTVIYQMKQDFSKLVPVVMDESKTKIVSYPAPRDMFDKQGNLRYPVDLGEGFYLDEIGIGIHTAYIDIEIEQYSRMLNPPTLDSLLKLVIETDPFKKMYNLGNRKQYPKVEPIKELVKSGAYKQYEQLK